MARLARWPRGRFLLEAGLRPYAQIVFSRDLATGLLILLAIGVFPRLVAATISAVVVAAFATWLLGLGAGAVRDGFHGCVAVLTTLALGVFATAAATPTLIVTGAVLSVLFTSSLRAVFARLELPPHSLPFVAAAWTTILAARVLPAPAATMSLLAPWRWIPDRLFESGPLDVAAAIVFLHGALTGILILAAIGIYSRIALLLACTGALVAAGVRATLRIDIPWSAIDLTAGFNAILSAMAIGGVWFVPHPTSIALAAAGAAVSCVLTYALLPVTSVFALPVLSLPFVATTHLILTAARVRERDRWPHSAPEADRPEEALAHHLMRARRYGRAGRLPFRLPFRGTWMVTQGHDGTHTHKGPWRYAFDFEGRGPDGTAFDHDGTELRQYRCYALPVLAAAPGIVDHIVDGVPDNPPGELDTRQNWGNAVVISHGAGLFTAYAHLQPRSIRLKPGDGVAAGTEIGRCGNSGRSAVPHLHFQVQRGAPLGSETVPADFGDVVIRADGPSTLLHHSVPAEGDLLRPVLRDEAVARVLAFPPGTAWVFSDPTSGTHERAVVDVDLRGRHLLRSDVARLYFEPYDAGLVVTAFDGNAGSLLRHMVLALSRVTFDQDSTLTWSDALPRRLFLPRWVWPAADLASALAPRVADIEITYRLRRSEGHLVIEGTAGRFSTRATIDLGQGPHRFELISEDHHMTVELTRDRGESEATRV